MTDNSANLRSEMSKVKGLGSAHHGVSHWWLQRLTALGMVPLSLWFFYSLLTAMLMPTAVKAAEWFASPFNAIFTVLLLSAAFIHAKLGVQVVIEDYVHSPFTKYALLLLNIFVCTILAAIAVLAVLKLHFLDMSSAV